MIPYYLLFIIPIFTYSIESRIVYKKKTKNITISVFFLIFTVMLALRSIECGTDLTNYKSYFNSVQNMSWQEIFNQDVETGYWVFQKLISYITNDFNVFLTIVAIICLLPIWIYYKTESDFSLLTVILFITVAPFSMFFSGLRQSIAMGVGILAWLCVKRKKIILFIITVLLAAAFHQSAIILLFLFPLYHIRITKNWIIPVALVMLLILAFNEQIFSFLISFSERYDERYNSITQTGAFGTLALLVIFAVYSFLIPDEQKMDKNTIALRNILLFSICVQCFAPIHSLAMRMNYYFLLFIPILIPKIIKYRKDGLLKLTNVSVWIITVAFIGIFFYKAYFGEDILQIFPYVPYWSN